MSEELNKTLHNKKALVEAMTKALGIVTTGCQLAGISRTTFYHYYKTDEVFQQEIDDINDIVLDFTESQLHKAIQNGNITAIIWHLKTKGKSRGYVERIEQHYSTDKFNLPEWMNTND